MQRTLSFGNFSSQTIFFFFSYSSWWMFRFNELAFSMNLPVLPTYVSPQVPSRGPGGVSWCQAAGAGTPRCPVSPASVPGSGSSWPQPSPLLPSAWGLSNLPHPPHMVLARPFCWGVYAGPGCDFFQIAVHPFCSEMILWFSVDDNNLGEKKRVFG